MTTGLSDNYNVEIKEGLQGGETVFQAYIVEQAWAEARNCHAHRDQKYL